MIKRNLIAVPAARFLVFATAWGDAALAWTDRGVRAFWLPGLSRERLLERIAADLPGARPGRPETAAAETVARAQRYFEGDRVEFDCPLDLSSATPFQQRVYAALRRVPFGQTVTYGGLAALAGSPGACRAVGGANAKNPVPLLVPCHRVLAAGGRPGGFSGPGGLPAKLRMLALEQAALERCGCG